MLQGDQNCPLLPCPWQGTVSPHLSSGNCSPASLIKPVNSYPKRQQLSQKAFFPPGAVDVSAGCSGWWVRHLAAWQSRQLGPLMVFITLFVCQHFTESIKNHKKEFTLQGGPSLLVSCLMLFQTARDYCSNSSLVFTAGFLTCV